MSRYYSFILSFLLLFFIPFIKTNQTSNINKNSTRISKFINKLNSLRTGAIKIPSVKSILDKYYYNRTDILVVTVKNLFSYRHQIPYDYSYLQLCQVNLDTPPEGISELLTGKKSSFTNFIFSMNINETCAISCIKTLTNEDVEKYKYLIKHNYRVTYYLDKLPSGRFITRFDNRKNITTNTTNYISGIPIGFKLMNDYYLTTHIRFYVSINKKNNQYQIVDFFASAYSVEQNDTKKCNENEDVYVYYMDENGNETENLEFPKNITMKQIYEDKKDIDYPDIINPILEKEKKPFYENAKKQELIAGKKIVFTYDVIFLESNITFSSRFDHYFNTKKGFRWLSLLYSNLIIFILTFMIFYILKRTVNKNLNYYNKKVEILEKEEPIIDEYGWKQINGDVFRRPKKLILLSAFIGTGIEILCIFLVVLILSIIAFLKPETRTEIINSIIYSIIFMSIVSGYVSTYIYKNNNGTDWLKNSIFTALLFPGITIFTIIISKILYSMEGSSASFKISQIAILILLWLFISSPLVFIGSLLCLIRPEIKFPCKVNKLPTKINKKPWYLHLQYAAWFTGIIPFFTIFIEFFYIMSYLWNYQVYFLASFLSLSVFFEVIISAEISIVFVFVNLCKGDYNWWWKSFFVSASPALYVFLFSVYYFFKIGLTRFTAIVVYFLIMSLITVSCALLCGACGTFITFWFVFYIYSKIKID